MKTLRNLILAVCLLICTQPLAVYAQDTAPSGPVYIVQSGDTLWMIAQRFGVTLDELVLANNLINADTLNEGDELVIPGLEGISGRLETRLVAFGENLTSLSRRYQAPMALLARLNKLSTSAELYAGYNLIIPIQDEQPEDLARRVLLEKGQSLLELAVLQGTNAWKVAAWNGMDSMAAALSGEVLHLPGDDGGPGALPPVFQKVSISPLPLIQGETITIKVQAEPGVTLSGKLLDHPLNFFSTSDSEYAALQGVHALIEPGIYPLILQVQTLDGSVVGMMQYLSVESGGYAVDPDLAVDPATIDEQVTRPEDAQWTALAQPATSEKLWDGPFAAPVGRDFATCWPSLYGNRRSYNNGAFKGFHTGLDFCGAVGQSIYAPAPGVVVFAGPLTVRGQATMIDHGWGIYTGYMHQSEILVQVGQRVETGEQIGLVGNTGRVTGPHLHFEVWVGGVQINPFDWLEKSFP